jgi:hypothetical protein
MCLIVHKPAGLAIPTELIEAAAAFNRDGWGLMGIGVDGKPLVERHGEVDTAQIERRLRALKQVELCLHLRLRTRGSAAADNAHPLKVSDRFQLMHNGTLKLPARVAGRSDSWHLAVDVLRPLAVNWPDMLGHPSFLALVEAGLTQENKLVLMDNENGRMIFFNRQHGGEFEGLWLSSTRWIDRRRFALAQAPQPQQKTYSPDELHFL